MRKILSAALALVCIWFATPAHANCNLFDINNPVAGTGYNVTKNGNNIVAVAKSGTSSASRIMFFVPVSHFKPNTRYYISTKADKEFYATYLAIGIAQPNSGSDGLADYGRINGKENNGFSGTFKITDIGVNQEYVSFYYYLGEQPEGTQITISDIMITEGSTAPTEYTPYNPLCATCNGTIVNYTSATGTGVQNGTPTPENPIEPTFYKQGNMILRKVGDYADSYDATTGKITRRVGVKVFDGTEDWRSSGSYTGSCYLASITNSASDKLIYNTHFIGHAGTSGYSVGMSIINNNALSVWKSADTTPTTLKQYLAQQYAAGTPVTVWYPLRTETTEDWAATQCLQNIRVATTKYNETAFSPLNTALQNAISVVDTVVSNTITQAASIATLQTQKQTRPNDIADDSEKCPAGKKCLLVEDASGVPHWYEIVENAYVLPSGYTQLQYIESTGTQYIDTGIIPSEANNIYIRFKNTTTNAGYLIGAANGSNRYNYVGIHAAFQGYGENWGSGGDYKGFNIPADTTTIHTIEIDLRNTPQFYFDSVLKATQSPYETINSTNNLIINANVAGTQNRCSAQYYEVKLSNNGTLIRDFVPAKNPDGKIGMYDKVNGVFYENQGTGEFIPGDPVSE